jgi:hypothetical protein
MSVDSLGLPKFGYIGAMMVFIIHYSLPDSSDCLYYPHLHIA